MYKNRRTLSGFSIVQVMVGLVLMGIAISGFMAFLNSAQRGQKNVQNSVDFDILKTSLNLVFSTKACNGALYGTGGNQLSFTFPAPLTMGQNILGAGNSLPIHEIRHGSTVLVQAAGALDGGMQVERLEIAEAVYDGDTFVDGQSYRAFAARILLNIKKADGSLGAKKLTTSLGVKLLARATGPAIGQIERCAEVQDDVTFPVRVVKPGHLIVTETMPVNFGVNNTHGQLLMSSLYQPRKALRPVKVTATGFFGLAGSAVNAVFALFQDSATAPFVANVMGVGAAHYKGSYYLEGVFAPADLTPVLITLRAGPDSANGGTMIVGSGASGAVFSGLGSYTFASQTNTLPPMTFTFEEISQ